MTGGARYSISIDGTVRTHLDVQELAIEAAEFLKLQNPHSKVVIRDLLTGETTETQSRKPTIGSDSGAPGGVCFRGQTGKLTLVLRFTVPDPERKSSGRICCDAQDNPRPACDNVILA
jgi:hypothetical protein